MFFLRFFLGLPAQIFPKRWVTSEKTGSLGTGPLFPRPEPMDPLHPTSDQRDVVPSAVCFFFPASLGGYGLGEVEAREEPTKI